MGVCYISGFVVIIKHSLKVTSWISRRLMDKSFTLNSVIKHLEYDQFNINRTFQQRRDSTLPLRN